MPLPPHLRRCERYLDRCRSHPDELRVLAIGDSWLSLPGNLWDGRNVVQFLNDRRWTGANGSRPMNVLSFAHPGKELADMSRDFDLHQGLGFLQELGERRGITFGFQAVIVTGGGNDILPFPERFIGPGADGNGTVLQARLAAALQDIRESWGDLLELAAPWRCPVIAHGYGSVTPTLKSGKIVIPFKGIGPWVGKHLLGTLGLPVERGRALIGEVIDRLNDTMRAIPGLSWFDARDAVASIRPSDWHDEIHFFEPGWEILAKRWLEAIADHVAAPVVMTAAPRAAARRRVADLTPQRKNLKPFTKDAVAEAVARDAAKRPAARKPKAARPAARKKPARKRG
ncbi:MAG TPA: hypothetical protein VLF18_01945 [Tahibacter sp.]|uniref:hypothetical protein n=1 Tax=Tahibacter sp. TaxID=2056211 RepID=UPI002C708F57|nr:hypothetical protein [Tahibacter sp.]HSX58938.1 hypothetical protein [Tahibacter sp.]